ncbi:cellulase family glycosylhydrolase [Patescibacteria group bacterium]|nr:cellulase family glycosylhydrolase [Patescibacteria group bacterium]
MKKRFKKWLGIIILLFLIYLVYWLYTVDFSQDKEVEFGVTFSNKYAQELSLDSRQVLIAILDDLKVKKFRLMAYWDEIEQLQDSYNFSQLDWQLQEISQRQGEVILSIGHRLPRWPECHWPGWTFQLSREQRQQKILELLEKTVKRYQNNSVIKAWQIENEPFLKVFGECPKPDKDFFKQEVQLVRSLDNRPVIITESGELSTWLRAAKLADYVGSSVYRITWNKRWGYFYYPLPPSHYYLKAQIVRLLTSAKGVFVSEMQMEPWLGMPALLTPLSEQYHSMNVQQFQKNLNYAKRTGLSPNYLWGAEWWYWLREQGDGSIWQLAKEIWR